MKAIDCFPLKKGLNLDCRNRFIVLLSFTFLKYIFYNTIIRLGLSDLRLLRDAAAGNSITPAIISIRSQQLGCNRVFCASVSISPFFYYYCH